MANRVKLPSSRLVLQATALGMLLLLCALFAAALYFGTRYGLSVQTIEDSIQSMGAWGVMGSIGLMVLHSFVPFPAEFLAIANGMVYGPVWGTVITWTGAMLGAFLAFGLARALGRPFVAMMVARKDWDLLDEWAAMRGGRLVLISRLIPVIAFNLINYAAGLTRITYWKFIWATGLGILPMTILMVWMGAEMHALSPATWLLFAIAVLGLWFIARRLLARRRPT